MSCGCGVNPIRHGATFASYLCFRILPPLLSFRAQHVTFFGFDLNQPLLVRALGSSRGIITRFYSSVAYQTNKPTTPSRGFYGRHGDSSSSSSSSRLRRNDDFSTTTTTGTCWSTAYHSGVTLGSSTSTF